MHAAHKNPKKITHTLPKKTQEKEKRGKNENMTKLASKRA